MPWKTRLLLSACMILVCGVTSGYAQYKYPFQNPDLPVEQRIDNILSLMTLQEKIQCLGTNPSVPRLGIHATGQVEGLHGLALGGPAHWGRKHPVTTTQFPQSVGLGETWDPALIQQAAALEGKEARYVVQSSLYHSGSLVIRAPNADLARDPRWGRSEESYGEDPFFNGTMTVAFVHGLQGNDPKYWQAASLMKHFLANSNEDGRGGSSSNFDERLLREYYSVPFRMGVEQGGSRAFMAAYNAVNGIPCTVQPFLRNMAIDEWGQNGIICTDAGGLTNMVTLHKYYPDLPHAAAGAVKAGINQFLDRYRPGVEAALQQHLLTEADIDRALRGSFRVMIHLGLLDPPQMVPYTRIGTDGAAPPWTAASTKSLVRRVTDESIVLLKNRHGFLPLDRHKLKSIAVIGPHANDVLLDWYSGTPPYMVSPLQGIRAKVGKHVTVRYAANNDHGAAVNLARSSDVAIVIVGNSPTCDAGWAKCPDPSQGKEALDRKRITLTQEDLVQQVFKANPHTVVVLIASFPYAINWTQQHVPAIVHMAHNSEEEGNALADVLFGDYNPAGRLVTTWPRSLAQLPPMMDYNIRDGRTYMYFKGKPLYPFGYGLSYTTFKYSNMQVSSTRLARDGKIDVRVDVTNTGSRAGDEVVQLYVRHLHSAVTRPKEELRGFRRVHLDAGETKTVMIPLSAASLAYWNTAQHCMLVEADKVRVMIGSSSADIKTTKTITVVK
jgi:beta-glucosidase